MTAMAAAPAVRARRRRQARRMRSRPDVTFVAPLLPRLIVEPVRKRRVVRRVECPGDNGQRRRGWRTRCASGCSARSRCGTKARSLLADQLGVDPSDQLEQVYLRILRGEEGLAAVAQAAARTSDLSFISAERAVVSHPRTGPGRVPNPLTSFVGRDRDVTGVRKNLAAARLVTLTGPGGVGKTRLAAEACGSLDATAWFVELAPVTDPSEVAYAVLEAVGVREPVIARRAPEPGAGPLDRLTAALAERDEVLVLDNCEHVIEAAATLASRVLADCPRMRILATSRQPLRIDGETLWPVPPLPVPPASSDLPGAPDFQSYGSVRLLCDRATAVRPDFHLDQGNAASVARICRTLDGMQASHGRWKRSGRRWPTRWPTSPGGPTTRRRPTRSPWPPPRSRPRSKPCCVGSPRAAAAPTWESTGYLPHDPRFAGQLIKWPRPGGAGAVPRPPAPVTSCDDRRGPPAARRPRRSRAPTAAT